ncbi:uncharacterized protein LOC130901070 isoform X1 [Diorhabda carinulata]|uniref:uncharacterized protein LOC130901070 isoform X1 n=1 Tax=Diorhabda carinulata TaxID=1163345 RepID=UPI0025A2DB13|nr:uncharacterized protein LOC130901070 isoform X1 [Diorhabda carinulata]XP_057668136.1 uncharacterized protein LOC130901070 isoform X1 [Diorhabda carinulata]
MSKRKLKELVGSRQKCRRALQATKQEFQYKSRTSVNPGRGAENVDETNDCFFFNDTISSNTSSTSTSTSSVKVDKSISSDNNDSLCTETSIANDLAEWAIKHKISLSALTHLLHLLHPYHPELPLDSRTLLSTPKFTPIVDIESGQFCYFGLRSALSKLISNDTCVDKIQISFNVDGIPLFKSSKMQFWPILGLIKNISGSRPFAISIFCGKNKPHPLNTFLHPFIVELKDLLQNGFVICNKHFTLEVHSFVCDAPARAYLKGTKFHSGYSSCDRCTIHGEYYKHKVVFNGLNGQKRTNESFRLQLDDEHHISQTSFLELPIDLISSFPIDYMHNICLGVVRKLLNTWIAGSLKVRLQHQRVKMISERLLNLKNMIPVEFNRKPRSLNELNYWKATEYRMFLVYLGPLVLKDIVDLAIYENFLALHFSVSILLSQSHIEKFKIPFVRNIINVFIKHSKSLYGLEFMVYNVHLMSHLCDDVDLLGKLDNFSTFPFENYLGEIKSLIKSPTNPLQQVHRRLVEKDFLISQPVSNMTYKLESKHTLGPLIFDENLKWNQQFHKLRLPGITLSACNHSKADSYVLIGNKIVEIHNIVKSADSQIYLIGKEFLGYSDLYTYPYPSSNLNIFIVENLTDLKIWPVGKITAKCIVLELRGSLMAMPIIHSQF